jgi:hypothetical protein
MEIEFNTRRILRPDYSQPQTQRLAQAGEQASSSSGSMPETSANQVSAVRPEKVAEAKTLVADESYPPNYLLDRIATLLAVRMSE